MHIKNLCMKYSYTLEGTWKYESSFIILFILLLRYYYFVAENILPLTKQ